jgi:uncharacterized protein
MFPRWLDISQDKSCLIIGPRRSGKTTLLKSLFPIMPYVTLDDLDALDWAQRDPKGFISSLGKEAIIDEIQRVPRLTIAIKYAVDNLGSRFFMTGSSSMGLMDSAADTLAGRYRLYHLPPACWGENDGPPNHKIFQDVLTLPEVKNANRQFDRACKYGQFPEILESETDHDRKLLLREYRDTYFIRDIMYLSNIENRSGLLALFHNIARTIGSHLETSHFAREAGISFVTAKKYLNILHASEMTFSLPGYQWGPAKRFIKASKTYFSDSGILESLGVDVSEGQRFENFVVAELEKRRKLGFIDADQFYYYRSSNGREIDVIFTSSGIVHAIEIRSSAGISGRDIRNLREFVGQMKCDVRAYIIYRGEEFDRIDGIQLLPVSAFFRGT